MADFPEGANLSQDDSDTGDVCHFLVNGMGKAFYRGIAKNTPLGQFQICEGDDARSLEYADVCAQNPPI